MAAITTSVVLLVLRQGDIYGVLVWYCY